MKKIHFSGAGNTNVVKINSYGNGILYHKCTLPRMFYYHKQLNAERWNLLSQVYNLKISGVLFQAKEKELVDFEIFHSHLFLFYCVCLFSSITYACQIHQKHTSAAYILSLMRCSDPVCPSGSGIELFGVCVPKHFLSELKWTNSSLCEWRCEDYYCNFNIRVFLQLVQSCQKGFHSSKKSYLQMFIQLS